MKSYLVTGGNRGLGFAMAKNLAKQPDTEVVLAVRNLQAGEVAAKQLGENVTALELDMSSAESIDRLVSNWERPLAGLINNAGLQIVDGSRFTAPENYEQTFAVNHLFALKLTLGLLPYLENGRVLFIGSGTHHPKNWTATIFGFRGALYESIKKCAEGLNSSEKSDQLGMDQYATSKFLNMVSTVELARRIDAKQTAFYCLDPGLMPGTGLARTAPSHLQLAWNYVLPVVAKFMPDSSTPERSGEAGAWLMTTDQNAISSGGIYSYDMKPSKRVWDKVHDPAVGASVLDESLQLLGIEM